ncbi:gamma-glutamylcyclotransferase [Sphingobium sp. SCG-1]|uniref:gamma-glutamylcyclotransferase family protein n=1 Tax=Sphingobium sp. SCG-1 TaxID=2072936 RepID=UPI000CD696E6|nr:gamma-glutamylcyclotransferase family protein [Sphingobium sp. SCG-1]AUW56762.1 gamma-glutamylcyclotransferase [Sphingobium sp. SCG-1]
MNSTGVHLFVYGTLRRGSTSPMAALLDAQSQRIGTAQARGSLYALHGYPGFLPDGGEDWVIGDLFSILPEQAEPVLSALDDYEECSPAFPQPHEYRRAMVEVNIQGEILDAWTYVYAWPTTGLTRIKSGDWLAWSS